MKKGIGFKVLGVWLVLSGISGICSRSYEGIVLGAVFIIGGIFLFIKSPKISKASRSVSSNRPTTTATAVTAASVSSKYAARPKDIQAMNAFVVPLNGTPRYPISGTGEYIKPLLVKDLTAMPHTNITKTTSSDKYFRFVSIDIETTGLNATCDIIEVSAIKFVANEPVEIFTTLCKSDHPIPADAAKINHITDNMIANAPYFYKILPDLQSFIADFPLVAHNIDFDLKFLQRYGLILKPDERYYFDTLDLSRKCIKKDNGGDYRDLRVDNYNLGTICRFFGIKLPPVHRALCDAYATGLIFMKLTARIADR